MAFFDFESRREREILGVVASSTPSEEQTAGAVAAVVAWYDKVTIVSFAPWFLSLVFALQSGALVACNTKRFAPKCKETSSLQRKDRIYTHTQIHSDDGIKKRVEPNNFCSDGQQPHSHCPRRGKGAKSGNIHRLVVSPRK